MRTVVVTSPGVVELNYMWLPTWIGSSALLKQKIEKGLREKVVGRPLTEMELDMINDEVIDCLVEEFPTIEGLRDYLDGLKYVKFRELTCHAPTGSTFG